MATIKSYTDIEQSKKLAKILPLESADMRYQVRYDSKNNLKYIPGFISTIIPLRNDIPCWSLAALFGVLPNENMLVKTTDGEYYCLAKDVMTEHYDNPVDACYELILKLNKLNLL